MPPDTYEEEWHGRELSGGDERKRPERGTSNRRARDEDESPRQRDEEQALGDVGREDPAEETEAEEAPESQQAG